MHRLFRGLIPFTTMAFVFLSACSALQPQLTALTEPATIVFTLSDETNKANGMLSVAETLREAQLKVSP